MSAVASRLQETGRTTNPLFNDNRLKLGTFCTNVSNGAIASTAEGALDLTWRSTLNITRASDQAGLEAIVPLGRWRGYGGVTDFNGRSFEGNTWAAGLAGVTNYSALLSTSHVPHFHPVLAAKQGSTVDHISNGRFGLNVVSGADPAEFAMFGGTLRQHDEAYAYAEEWIQILFKLWTAEEPFDFDGRFFHITGAISLPRPIQQPHPAIMCANASDIGRRFAAKYADLSFVNFMSGDLPEWRAQVDSYKRLARDDFDRDLGIWTKAFVICRPTQREADEYFQYVAVQKADVEGDPTRVFARDDARTTARAQAGYATKVETGTLLRRNPGWPGHPLVGTAEQIVDGLHKLSSAGIDGCLLFWVDFEREQQQFIDEVLPLMEQAGLRQPFQPRPVST